MGKGESIDKHTRRYEIVARLREEKIRKKLGVERVVMVVEVKGRRTDRESKSNNMVGRIKVLCEPAGLG